jgi:2-polyprenyl-3-methyl-5-hydroxy-6-metoxy-1,4-benzoquinol methylase
MRRARTTATFWVAEQSLAHLESIRLHELSAVLELIPPESHILEIGAGTGWQAQALERQGHKVSAIELASSNYRDRKVWPVTEYDGEHIPYAPHSFDIVFSSNVLEHIPHVREFQREIHRVLKPTGHAIHVVPSSTWSVWTNLTTLLKYWTIARPHGEHAANATVEIFHFSRRAWIDLFESSGWIVTLHKPVRLFYSGCSVMDQRLSMRSRAKLSYLLGGSCNLFMLH